MSHNIITFHIINDIPWSNLNRDDSGTPKRTILGGIERGMLSSQSIKRAIRKDYENRILEEIPEEFKYIPHMDGSKISDSSTIRSRYTVQWVLKRAKELAVEKGIELNEKKVISNANAIVKKLVGGEDTIIWLSIEELEALAHVLIEDFETSENKDILDSFIKDKKSGSLAIAAFGRMFASAANKNTDAAIAVSPAISTHGNLIETDYFIAGDDFGFFSKDKKTKEVKISYEGAGAGHLGVALYTSGIFYRTISIDIRELIQNWTGVTSKNAEIHIRQLVLSIINSLPSGKNNSTAPYTTLPLVIVERQNYREAYSIAEPVQPHEDGGFLRNTIENIKDQIDKSRSFNIANYSNTLFTGQYASEFTDEKMTLEDICAKVSEWVLNEVHIPAEAESEGSNVLDESTITLNENLDF